jgi:hypothetical protein
MIDDDIAAELVELARAIARMKPPSSRNPDAFHEDRSELASRARSIAARLKAGPVAKPPIGETPAPVGRQQTSAHQVQDLEGRSILVLTRRDRIRAPLSLGLATMR